MIANCSCDLIFTRYNASQFCKLINDYLRHSRFQLVSQVWLQDLAPLDPVSRVSGDLWCAGLASRSITLSMLSVASCQHRCFLHLGLLINLPPPVETFLAEVLLEGESLRLEEVLLLGSLPP